MMRIQRGKKAKGAPARIDVSKAARVPQHRTGICGDVYADAMLKSNAVWITRCLMLLAIAMLAGAPRTVAQESPSTMGDWESLGISQAVLEFSITASGGLFARTEEGLLRSIDA